MLDIELLRKEPGKIKDALKKRGVVGIDLKHLQKLDEARRKLISQIDGLKQQRNVLSEEIGKEKDAAKPGSENSAAAKGGKMAKPAEFLLPGKIKKAAGLKQEIEELEKQLEGIEKEFDALWHQVPNIPLDSVPVGKSEEDNKIVREVGERRKFNFQPKDYLTIAESSDLIDMKRAAKVSGSRFGYIKGGLARLEFAIVQFVFDELSQKGFVPVVPPVMIKPDVFEKMARLDPTQAEERYFLPKDNLYLVGSAEHTLGPMHLDEALNEADLPRRYVGFSTSFRREAGSYGKDTKGILRVHQFDKVEMESFCAPEKSPEEFEFIVSCQEQLMQKLGLPYQVVEICTADMGGPDARQVDLNAWMPGQEVYRETHTADYMTDYQSRRLNTKVKRANGKTEYVHMIDATAFAIGRTLIAIIENYQQENGSIAVPEVLQKYVGFKIIKALGN